MSQQEALEEVMVGKWALPRCPLLLLPLIIRHVVTQWEMVVAAAAMSGTETPIALTSAFYEASVH